MKNVLLLSCNTGQGHNSCANSIKDYFEEKGVHCEIQDALTFISKGVSKFASWGHSFMYLYLPSLFRFGYTYSKEHPWVFRQNSAFYRILTLGTERMYDYIRQKKIDTVICTHIFPAIMMTYLGKQYTLPIRTAFVPTDYTYFPGTSSTDLDRYFIPSKYLFHVYRNLGIPPEHIIPSGIPVGRDFWQHVDREKAKGLLGISRKKKHLLVMCGSMGCGPIAKILRQIVRQLPSDVEVTVICGRNKRLYRKLKVRYYGNKRIHVIGYTTRMPLYLSSALYLTKPGGISVTEAAVKNVPMAFINAVAGCEQYNMDFFVSLGAAFTADTTTELVDKCVAVLEDDEKRGLMQKVLNYFGPIDSAACIYQEMSGDWA